MKIFVLQILLITALAGGCAGQRPPDSAPGHTPRTGADPAHPGAYRSREHVLKTVRDMVGTGYRYGGESPSGFDCSGLVFYAHRLAGIRVPRTAAEQYRVADKISTNKLKPGDLVFFRLHRGRTWHVGTYTGKGRFVHAPSSGKRVMVSNLNDAFWQKHLVGAGNFY